MELLAELAKGGLLSLLLAISLTANVTFVKMILAEKDKRIAGAEKVRDDLITPISYIKDSLALIQQKIQVSKDRSDT